MALRVGYYDDPNQTEPAFDPGLTACPHCGEMVTPDDVRTISVMDASERLRSLFYRMHRTCAESLSEEMARYYDMLALHPPTPSSEKDGAA